MRSSRFLVSMKLPNSSYVLDSYFQKCEMKTCISWFFFLDTLDGHRCSHLLSLKLVNQKVEGNYHISKEILTLIVCFLGLRIAQIPLRQLKDVCLLSMGSQSTWYSFPCSEHTLFRTVFIRLESSRSIHS